MAPISQPEACQIKQPLPSLANVGTDTSNINIATANKTTIPAFAPAPIPIPTRKARIPILRITNTNTTTTNKPIIPTRKTNTPTRKTNIFSLPIEIRLMIYPYLLTAPDLDNAKSIPNQTLDDRPEDETSTLGLHPQILRTCRQFYFEGMPTLYSSTFLIDCTGLSQPKPLYDRRPWEPSPRFNRFPNPDLRSWNLSHLPHTSHAHLPGRNLHTPLTRHSPSQLDFLYTEGTSRPFPSLNHVRHFKILVPSIPRPSIQSTLLDFCRHVCLRSDISLTILIMPFGVEKPRSRSLSIAANDADLLQILEPLKLLRNIRGLEFRCAVPGEVPLACVSRHAVRDHENGLSVYSPRFPPQLPCPEWQTMTKKLVMSGANPVEHIHLMYHNLLSYAQSFESNIQFKKDMGLLARQDLLYCSPTIENQPRSSSNTFKSRRPHFIEANLEVAQMAVTRNHMALFQETRTKIFEHLETQYFAISKNACKMREFLQMETRADNGIFHAQGSSVKSWRVRFASAIERLEEFAGAFERSAMSKERKMAITAMNLALGKRERLVKDTKVAYEKLVDFHSSLARSHVPSCDSNDGCSCKEILNQKFRYQALLNLYQKAVDEMENHFREIRNQRKSLFRWDMSLESQKEKFDLDSDSDFEMPSGELEGMK